MSVNLLSQLQEKIGDVLIAKGSDLFNESQEEIQKATGAILPALLGSIVQKGSSENGANTLLNTIKEGNYNGGLLENIANILGDSGNALDDLLKKGGAIVADLIGDDQPGLTNMIANYAGTEKESTGSLIHLTAPLLMSLLGKHVQNEGLNAGGLMNLLSGQKKYIKEAVPPDLAGIGKLLGFSGELSDMGKVAAQPRSRKSLAWLIGILAVLLIAALIYYFAFRKGQPTPAAEDMPDTTEQAAQPATPAAGGEEPAGVSSKISTLLAEGGDFQDEVFTFVNPEFVNGSSQASQSLIIETNDLATLLNRYPNLNVKLTVYTQEDLELAQFRSLTLKNRLQDQGVSSDRITPEGATGEESRIEVELTQRGG
jgi:OOP family OmpA-OmpF porin